MKKALITGVTGQDGSYLSELLLENGYDKVTVKVFVEVSPEFLAHKNFKSICKAQLKRKLD